MPLFDVYPLYNVTPVMGRGIEITDDKGVKYHDFYGGHAVISIGHSHPHYIRRLEEQLKKLAFYSNSIHNPIQLELAEKLEILSGCTGYQLFMCNSGAEANENALKIASFVTGKSKVISFRNSFHGRTSAAVATTDSPKINAPINLQQKVDFLPLNHFEIFEKTIASGDHCAVIIEAIQGVGGLDQPSTEFYQFILEKCEKYKVMLIADEVQSGFGRSGKFFAFQHHTTIESDLQPHIITIAKGMGNGFPVGGVLVHPNLKPWSGMLGTTFGGNHLACAAVMAVLEIIEQEDLIKNASMMGQYFIDKSKEISTLKQLKGRGLMLGLEFNFEVAELRKNLIYEQKMFTGGSANKNLLRFLPALNINKNQIDIFYQGLKNALEQMPISN